MVGGVISDIYHAKDRNTPMALFSASALFGTGLAPLIAGVIVSHTSWRWIYYSHAIVSAVFVLVIFVFFKETRGSVLLSRKAKTLNTYYEALENAGHYGVLLSDEEQSEDKSARRIRWKVKSDEQRASLLTMIQISLYRPFRTSSCQRPFLLRLLLIIDQKTCSSQNPSFSSSHSGYPSAGQRFTCSSALFRSSSARTTASTSNKQALYSQVRPKQRFPFPTQSLIRSNSNVRRRYSHHYHQHLARKDRRPLRETLLLRRRPSLLRLRRICSPPHRSLLVWLDLVPLHPLDRAHSGRWLCHNGHLLHLPGYVQLLGRYVPSLRQLGYRGAILLSESAGGCLPVGDDGYVQ